MALDNSIIAKCGIAGAILFSLAYILPWLSTNDPDFIFSVLGNFGLAIEYISWATYLIGGWKLAIASTIAFFILIGFSVGALLGLIISVFKKEKKF